MSFIEHPDYPKLEARMQVLLGSKVAFDEDLIRMVKPRYCSDQDILNGVGGQRANGRWNLRGFFRCTYASGTPETALAESLSQVRRGTLPDAKALPRMIVCIRVRVSKALDLTDGKIRQRLGVSEARMTDATKWKQDNYHNHESLTQAIGRAAFSAGFEAMVAPSAADRPHGVVIVVFPEKLLTGSLLTVVTPVNP